MFVSFVNKVPLTICHCTQPCSIHGQPIALLASHTQLSPLQLNRIQPFLSIGACSDPLHFETGLLKLVSGTGSMLICTIWPVQLFQNAASSLLKFSYTTHLLHTLHWLPVAVHIRYKPLMPTKAKNGPVPNSLKSLITLRSAPCSCWSSHTAWLDPLFLKVQWRHASELFSVLASRWMKQLPLAVTCWVTVFKQRLTTSSSSTLAHWF